MNCVNDLFELKYLNNYLPSVITSIITCHIYIYIYIYILSCITHSLVILCFSLLPIHKVSYLTFSFFLPFQAKKHQNGYFEGIEWYMLLISGIVGVLIGIGLVYGLLWIRRRSVLATQRGTQYTAGSTIYSELATPVTSRLGDSPIGGEQSSPEAVPLTMFHRETTRS